jgi:hypothetical protein
MNADAWLQICAHLRHARRNAQTCRTDLNILNALYFNGAKIMPVPEVEPENDELNAIRREKR